MEALSLFDEICNSRWFRHTSMILFLNKTGTVIAIHPCCSSERTLSVVPSNALAVRTELSEFMSVIVNIKQVGGNRSLIKVVTRNNYRDSLRPLCPPPPPLVHLSLSCSDIFFLRPFEPQKIEFQFRPVTSLSFLLIYLSRSEEKE